MKTIVASALLALALAGPLGAADAPPAAGPDLDRQVKELAAALQTATQDLADVQKRLDLVERRLGESYRGVSTFNTVERRLDDLEKDVDDVKRRR